MHAGESELLTASEFCEDYLPSCVHAFVPRTGKVWTHAADANKLLHRADPGTG